MNAKLLLIVCGIAAGPSALADEIEQPSEARRSSDGDKYGSAKPAVVSETTNAARPHGQYKRPIPRRPRQLHAGSNSSTATNIGRVKTPRTDASLAGVGCGPRGGGAQ